MEIINNPKRDLDNSTAILVLGILSLIFCWCYGAIGLILGIIAVVMGNTQRKKYLECPADYTESSFRNVNSGRTCGIIAICLSAFILIFWVLVILGMVVGLSAASFALS